jgi:hypothetical protein
MEAPLLTVIAMPGAAARHISLGSTIKMKYRKTGETPHE